MGHDEPCKHLLAMELCKDVESRRPAALLVTLRRASVGTEDVRPKPTTVILEDCSNRVGDELPGPAIYQ